jgi:hypothetical protein
MFAIGAQPRKGRLNLQCVMLKGQGHEIHNVRACCFVFNFVIARVGSGCACRKLHPAILMMKPAQDGLSGELAEPLNLSTAWRILPQGQMRSELVVIADVGRKDAAQVGLAEDDDVIEAFPTDRADQSLRMAVLPR